MNDSIPRIYNIITFIMLGIVAFFAYSVYRVTTETVPLSFEPTGSEADPFLIDKKVFKKGEAISFTFERCADYPLSYDFTQVIKNLNTGKETTLDSLTITDIEEGCDIVESIPKIIPYTVDDGSNFRLEFGVSVPAKYKSSPFIIPIKTSTFSIEGDCTNTCANLNVREIPVSGNNINPTQEVLDRRIELRDRTEPTPTPQEDSNSTPTDDPTPSIQPTPSEQPQEPQPTPTPTTEENQPQNNDEEEPPASARGNVFLEFGADLLDGIF